MNWLIILLQSQVALFLTNRRDNSQLSFQSKQAVVHYELLAQILPLTNLISYIRFALKSALLMEEPDLEVQ